MQILVTGIAGFVGSHLVELLLEETPQAILHGVVRTRAEVRAHRNLAPLKKVENIWLHTLELSDGAGVAALIKEVCPDYIFHLAAQSLPGHSFDNPTHTLINNQLAALNIFEGIRETQKTVSHYNPVVLSAGSGDQYGFVAPEDLPIRENQPFRPGSPYAVSKIAQEMLGYQYTRSYKLQIINTRAFNHLGPRQNSELATSSFARQIATLEYTLGKDERAVMKVGNLAARRDYTDVRDMVRGYWLAVSSGKCQPGEAYNLCSGVDHTMQEVLDILLNMADRPIEIEIDPARLRPSDIPVVRGDSSLFRALTGWKPKILLPESLQDLLNYWRDEVRK